ncbi:hypothetical protein EYF80_006533 [Liparis tanakae]|uniref:Uncharacterized protein n=1 Tax=Liparis tanakae TaxID=230148 RepID=A0A4Z2IYZ6_9TELE|nr:hypothetical protein EYF80_006533 [Liparis tanakae]
MSTPASPGPSCLAIVSHCGVSASSPTREDGETELRRDYSFGFDMDRHRQPVEGVIEGGQQRRSM